LLFPLRLRAFASRIRTMSHKPTIAVLGAGAWGTALAVLLARNGYPVVLWGHDAAQLERLARERTHPHALPGVTLLKPLCGAVPETYDNLANSCMLDYPKLQVVFGVADADDPAIAIVKRLKRDFPMVDIELVVSPERIGSNAKISNLHNMLKRAKHDVLLIADSDIRATFADSADRTTPLSQTVRPPGPASVTRSRYDVCSTPRPSASIVHENRGRSTSIPSGVAFFSTSGSVSRTRPPCPPPGCGRAAAPAGITAGRVAAVDATPAVLRNSLRSRVMAPPGVGGEASSIATFQTRASQCRCDLSS